MYLTLVDKKLIYVFKDLLNCFRDPESGHYFLLDLPFQSCLNGDICLKDMKSFDVSKI